MWSRSDLKSNAKLVLKRSYWKAVLVALILLVISGSGGSTSSRRSFNNYRDSYGSAYHYSDPEFWIGFMAVIVALFVFIIIIIAVATALSIFVFNPLAVGAQRFFIRSRTEDAPLKELGYAFHANYKNIVWIEFLRGLFTFLWSLLLFVPGFVKSYEYRMIPYLLAENPNLTQAEAFALSKQMMNGEKWNAFVLDLSFIGWNLLSAITFGLLGIFYVNPYYYLTFAELYAALKERQNPAQQQNPYQQNPYQNI